MFLFRFFEISQFKRSALPNGPKVVSGGNLSPRGDWRAPSDGNANVWLAELEQNVPRHEGGGLAVATFIPVNETEGSAYADVAVLILRDHHDPRHAAH